MTLLRALRPRAAAQHGLVTSADALAAGASRMALVMLARRGSIERVAYGIYRLPDLPADPLQRHQEAILRFPAGVLGHDTALALHGLCDIHPTAVHVTVPRRLRIRGQVPPWLAIHRVDLIPADITTLDGLAIVTPARAIIDGIESGVGGHLIDEAVQAARRRGLLTAADRLAIERALLLEQLRRIDEAAG